MNSEIIKDNFQCGPFIEVSRSQEILCFGRVLSSILKFSFLFDKNSYISSPTSALEK